MTVLLKMGVLRMSVETYEAIRELVQSRRLLQQTTDPSTMASLRNTIAELERRLLLEMTKGPPDRTVGQARN
jgi:transcriptional regulator of heat shock response